jgi:NADPH-dependent F420 reductase
MRVAIVGGTGDLGFGLALRVAATGIPVVIGSRAADRAEKAAVRARELLRGEASVEGAENGPAVERASLVFVTVPYEGQADIYRSIRERVPQGVAVCDTTTPLATAVGGRAWQVLTPWHGSAAEQARALLPKGTRLVAGFHSVGAGPMADLDRSVEGDVLLCGDDDPAKAEVGELVERIPGLRWIDCGPLSMARIAEPLTAILISVNRRYGIKDAGFRITGRDTWGLPPSRGDGPRGR